jgi:SAM-dependent methyltransferase
MSLYSRHILPRIIDWFMRNEEASRLRARSVPAARGVVLEIGFGSGLNLPFYTSAVTKIYGVDPSAELLAMARARIADVPFPVELLNQPAERIPLPDRSVDTGVVTWSLCSIANPEAALEEMRRVLRPDGSLIFVEHGLSPDAKVRAWQNRLNPFWRRLAGGCHLNRKVDDLIRAGGFSISNLDTEYIPGPRPMTYTYLGIGTPDGRHDSTRH